MDILSADRSFWLSRAWNELGISTCFSICCVKHHLTLWAALRRRIWCPHGTSLLRCRRPRAPASRGPNTYGPGSRGELLRHKSPSCGGSHAKSPGCPLLWWRSGRIQLLTLQPNANTTRSLFVPSIVSGMPLSAPLGWLDRGLCLANRLGGWCPCTSCRARGALGLACRT
eukprot:scaffold2408_cov386-Prasinococcus_capsulatus_cf.AAC.8